MKWLYNGASVILLVLYFTTESESKKNLYLLAALFLSVSSVICFKLDEILKQLKK
jgi:hypothetical protein